MRVFFLPRLHPKLTPDEWPEFFLSHTIEALFWDVGLGETAPNMYTPAYVWSVAQAKAFLRDTNEVHTSQSLLSKATSLVPEPVASAPLSDAEKHDLAAFAGGKPIPDMTENPTDEPWRVRNHQVLLLAWQREKEFLEIQNLTQKLHTQKSTLETILADPTETQPEPMPGTKFPVAPPSLEDLPNAHRVLFALSAFLPQSPIHGQEADALFLNSGDFAPLAPPFDTPCNHTDCPLKKSGPLPQTLTCGRTSVANLLAGSSVGKPLSPAAAITRCCFIPKQTV